MVTSKPLNVSGIFHVESLKLLQGELKKHPRLKGHCSLDIEIMTLASTSFDARQVQIYFKIYMTEIGRSVLKL